MPANDDIRDDLLRHEVYARRWASGEVNRMLDLLEAADRDTVLKIRAELKKLLALGGDPRDSRNLKRLQAALEQIREARDQAMELIAAGSVKATVDFAKAEADFVVGVLERNIPIRISTPTITLPKVEAIVNNTPFAGRALGDWWKNLAQADQERVLSQIRIGVLQGESIPNIVKRIAGTRANKFKDGALAVTRRQAEAIVRTGANGSANAARLAVFESMAPVIGVLVWTSTLDGRTTLICKGRDGHIRPVAAGQEIPPEYTQPRLKPPLAAPPAHVSCRSTLSAVVDPEGLIGNRPFVRDSRNRRRREMDFRAQARDKAGREWRDLSPSERNARIKTERDAWAKANIGQVPAAEDYQTWLKRQPQGFQDDVLGKTRAQLFRTGKIDLDQFVDYSGETLTLNELRRLRPEVFESAGV